MVPPCINKFYILDLQPENSLVRYAVAQGHTRVHGVVAQRRTRRRASTWDDYIEHGVLEGDRAWRRRSPGSEQVNALGFCVGGTILGYRARRARGARRARRSPALTLLTALLDFSEPAMLDVFIDEPSVAAARSRRIGAGGILPGPGARRSCFQLLRAERPGVELRGRQLPKGETPPAFDLLYWNSDCTNLPGPMYCWYLRNTYLENNLREPGALTVCGEKVDLGSDRSCRATSTRSREDHIVPWRGAYASTQLLAGKQALRPRRHRATSPA